MLRVHFLVHIVFVFSAFFLGILFQERQLVKEKIEKIPLFVNIEVKKSSLSITKNSADIQILVNGNEQKGNTFEVIK